MIYFFTAYWLEDYIWSHSIDNGGGCIASKNSPSGILFAGLTPSDREPPGEMNSSASQTQHRFSKRVSIQCLLFALTCFTEEGKCLDGTGRARYMILELDLSIYISIGPLVYTSLFKAPKYHTVLTML